MDNLNNYLDIVFSNNILTIVLFALLIYATYTDIKYLKIYNKFNLLIIIIRIIFAFIPNCNLPFTFSNVLASVLSFMIFLTLAVIFMHKMGGDIKFIGSFMLFFNIEYMAMFLMISSILNMCYSLVLKIYLKKKQLELVKNSAYKENIFVLCMINLLFVKIPKNSDLINMAESDFNKYKLPFAPFFLMSYIITYILYLL